MSAFFSTSACHRGPVLKRQNQNFFFLTLLSETSVLAFFVGGGVVSESDKASLVFGKRKGRCCSEIEAEAEADAVITYICGLKHPRILSPSLWRIIII